MHKVHPSYARSRSALTLIEVLIATTLTLLLMLALAQGFKSLSDSVSEGRTKLALSDQLRGIAGLLRNDLDRCTASRTVMPQYPGPGYFKYYDGPIWDSSALQMNIMSNSLAPFSGSKWGDIDDILMFTARANSGEAFRGTIPQALMIISQLNQFDKAGLTSSDPIVSQFLSTISSIGVDLAWRTEVSIESDLAEIVWFMMPMIEGNRLPANIPTAAGYIDPTVVQSVVDIGPVDGMPDRLALCRRVLLIRPDIDLNPTPSNAQYRSLVNNLLNAPIAPKVALSTGAAATFRTHMYQFYQRCDLSLRPHKWDTGGSTYVLSVASNRLEDLQLPENRFAHFTFPVPASVGIPVDSATLPMLALTDEGAATSYLAMTNPVYLAALRTDTGVSNRGFMLPCFLRSRFDGTPVFLSLIHI